MSLPTLAAFPLESLDNEFGAYDYRPLRRDPAKPLQKGWDVFAVQTAILGIGGQLPKFGADGYAGDEFSVAIWRFQQSRSDLVDDGICGIMTQRALAVYIIDRLSAAQNLPHNLLYGQIEQESGWQLGNFTSIYPATGKRDLGVAQINSPLTDAACQFAFDVRLALGMIAGHADRGLRNRYEKYIGKPGAPTPQRAWELASGSWNQPSTADWCAAGAGRVGNAKFEDYIDKTTKYVLDWTP